MANDPDPTDENPLDPSQASVDRISKRAYYLWESEGCPQGRDLDYWERARELDAIASNPAAGLISADAPVWPDEAELEANLGEFPSRLVDQGERPQTPSKRTR